MSGQKKSTKSLYNKKESNTTYKNLEKLKYHVAPLKKKKHIHNFFSTTLYCLVLRNTEILLLKVLRLLKFCTEFKKEAEAIPICCLYLKSFAFVLKAHTHTCVHITVANTSHNKWWQNFFFLFPLLFKVRRWRFSGTAVITESKHGAPSGSIGVIFGRAGMSQWARGSVEWSGVRIGPGCLNSLLPGWRYFRDIKQGERLWTVSLHKVTAATTCIAVEYRGWSVSGFN